MKAVHENLIYASNMIKEQNERLKNKEKGFDFEQEIRKAEFTIAGATKLRDIAETTIKTELANLDISKGLKELKQIN